jgi:ribosomal protein S18 acetylase RimI-like enzyme
MKLIALSPENIDQYLDDCVALQSHLVKPDESIDPQQMRKTAASADYFIAGIEDDQVVGLGVVNKIIHPAGTNAYIDNIVVHPEYRGRGLAREIMDALEHKAAEWGATQIKLTCSRPEVQAMYEKRGYQEKVSTKYYVKKI